MQHQVETGPRLMASGGGRPPTPSFHTLAALGCALAVGALSCAAEPPSAARAGPPPSATAPASDEAAAGVAATAEAAAPDGGPTDADRARAFGQFLDSPRPMEVLDQGLQIAEDLRRRYRIDTGNPEADRRTAALKFQAEVLDRIVFSPEEVESTARRLGHSLDPAKCLNTCENVRRLADIELRKLALQAFASGRPMPGRVP